MDEINDAELFKQVFNQVNDIITIIEIKEDGSAGNFVHVNDMAVETLGYSREELTNMSPRDIGSKPLKNKEKIDQLISKGKVTFERVYNTKDGQSIPVEINSHMFKFKGQKVALSVARDITERKKAEVEINRLASIVESSVDAIIVYDLDGIVLNWNPAAEMIYGYSAQEMMGKNVSVLMEDEKWQENLQNIEKIKRGNVVSHFETTRIKKGGYEFDVSITLSPVRNLDGEIVGIAGIARDITERKKSEKALEYAQIQLENAMGLAQLVYWEMDPKTGNFIVNDRFYSLYGTTADEEGGYEVPVEYYIEKFVHPDDRGLVAETIQGAGETSPDDEQFEHRIVRKDGETRYIVVTIKIVYDDENNIIGAYGANQDITQRKKAEEDLRISEEKYRKIVEKFIQNALGLISEINKE
ncbi:PAS domain-containing protein [Methanobacterium alcaliphilum]|uniref:PAS domain-containing protein n=1 Tax=Methanobacterium alcaliphilum TaxID=392018 RepID=UPI00200AF1B4|nr:PAS domain S-box protein [Methanobacterium alcaliphilum]MCK9150844.1 PAS domain S-box protein [Methanobacterium alcaliphilum]